MFLASGRVSDAERDRVAAEVRGHGVPGRLTLEEFEERLQACLRLGDG